MDNQSHNVAYNLQKLYDFLQSYIEFDNKYMKNIN